MSVKVRSMLPKSPWCKSNTVVNYFNFDLYMKSVIAYSTFLSAIAFFQGIFN